MGKCSASTPALGAVPCRKPRLKPQFLVSQRKITNTSVHQYGNTLTSSALLLVDQAVNFCWLLCTQHTKTHQYHIGILYPHIVTLAHRFKPAPNTNNTSTGRHFRTSRQQLSNTFVNFLDGFHNFRFNTCFLIFRVVVWRRSLFDRNCNVVFQQIGWVSW